VAFSPDGKCIVFGAQKDRDNFCLELWNIENLDDVRPLRVTNKHYIRSLVFSPDGNYIFSGGMNLIVWDARSLEIIVTKSPHPKGSFDFIGSLAISPDGRHIVSGGKRLLLWNINDVKDITYKVLMNGEDYIDSLGFSPDGKYIALSKNNMFSKNYSLILWDIDNSKDYVLQMRGEGEGIHLLRFSSDGKIIAYYKSAGLIANFILYDISDLKNVTHKVFMEISSVGSAVCSPDGDKIVSVTQIGLNKKQFYLSILFTDEEMSVVNKLKEYTPDKLRLVYELCLRSLSGHVIPSSRCDEVKKTFGTLPEDMKDLLYKLKLFNKESVSSQGWFSGCTLF